MGRKVEYSAMRVVLEGEPTVWTTSTTTLALVNLENTQHRIGQLLAQCHASVSSLVNGSAGIDSQDMALGALGMLEELTKHLGNRGGVEMLQTKGRLSVHSNTHARHSSAV